MRVLFRRGQRDLCDHPKRPAELHRSLAVTGSFFGRPESVRGSSAPDDTTQDRSARFERSENEAEGQQGLDTGLEGIGSRYLLWSDGTDGMLSGCSRIAS